MMKRSAIVFGSSYGIGASIASALGKAGWGVAVVGRSTAVSPKYPNRGTVFSVADSIVQQGGAAIGLQCDVRSDEAIQSVVDQTEKHFGEGSIELMVYNTGAIHIGPVAQTPIKRYDLLHSVNSRGLYSAVQATLPKLLSDKNKNKEKRIRMVVVSPPIYSRFFRGKTAYAMTKVGMTVLVHGLSRELQGTNCGVVALWPAVAVESAATEVMMGGAEGRALLRKSDVFAAAVVNLSEDKNAAELNGQALIDEDYLAERCGWKPEDFAKYRCEPDREPPRMMPKKFPDLRVEEEEVELFKDAQIALRREQEQQKAKL